MPTKKPKSNLKYYDEIEQGSPEWLEFREYKFTGSNAYKLLTSFGAGSWAMGGRDNFTGNFHTKRGHLLETEALELYEQIEGVKCSTTGFVTNTKYPNCLYSPDAYRPDRTVEIKCFAVKEHLKAIQSPSVKIKAQCYFGQMIMERPLTDLVLYNPSDEIPLDKKLVIISIKRDKDIHDNFKSIIRGYNENRRGK